MNKLKREFFRNVCTTPWIDCDYLVGDKLQQDIRSWLSPPDPWKNHSVARESHLEGTATWFVGGNTFSEWKSSGPSSLLWIHGKRELPPGTYLFAEIDGFPPFVAGCGKSVLWYVRLPLFSTLRAYNVGQFHNYRGDRDYAKIWPRITRILLS